MQASSDERTLYQRWIDELWNGPNDHAELQRVAERLVTDDFVGHWPGRDAHGAEELARFVAEAKAMSADLAFEITVPPFSADGMVGARWEGEGTMGDGAVARFLGNDILRVKDGRIAEYWVATVQA